MKLIQVLLKLTLRPVFPAHSSANVPTLPIAPESVNTVVIWNVHLEPLSKRLTFAVDSPTLICGHAPLSSHIIESSDPLDSVRVQKAFGCELLKLLNSALNFLLTE